MYFKWAGGVIGSQTDWHTHDNWLDAAGSAHPTYHPGDTASRLDDVVCDSAVAYAIAGTVVDNKLNSLRVTADFVVPVVTDYIGATGTPLIFEANEVIVDASGNLYLKGDTGDGLMSVTVNGTATGRKVYLSGALGDIKPLSGAVEIGASSTISGELDFGGGSGSPVLTIKTGVTLPSVVSIRGGLATCESALTSLEAFGGTWTQSLGAITTIKTYDGTVYWNAGNVGTIEAVGGTVTGENGSGARYVDTVIAHPNGIMNLDNGLGNVHVRQYIEYEGGSVNVTAGVEHEEYKARTYAGASDAKLGVSPQSVAAAASVWGDDIYLAPWDRLEVLCTVGVSDATEVSFQLWKSAAPGSPPTGYTAITDPAALTFGATQNKTKKLTLWGYQLANLTNVALKVAVTGGTAALVSAEYQKFEA